MLQNADAISPPHESRWLNSNLSWMTLALPFSLFLLLIGLTEYLVKDNIERAKAESLRDLLASTIELRSLFEYNLNATLHLTSGLVSYLQSRRGEINSSELSPWLTNLQERAKYIRNIGIAPHNRITYVFPLEGNEGAVGLYYPDNPKQWPEVQKVIASHQPLLAGPLDLKQGGKGLIYRVPVFLDGGEYWGLLSTVLDFDALYTELQKRAKVDALEFAVVDAPTDGNERFLFGSQTVVQSHDVSVRLVIPGRSWMLLAKGVESVDLSRLGLLRVLAWAIALLIAMLLYAFLKAIRHQQQIALVLKESQSRLSQIVSSAPQGMAIVAGDGAFLTANPSLCECLGYSLIEIYNTSFIALLPSQLQREIFEVLQSTEVHRSARNNQFETTLLHANQTRVAVILSLAPLQRQGEWVLQVLDVSERNRLEKMKNEFVSSVSHELRTPLTSIVASLRLMNSGVLGDFNERCKKMITIAYQNGERLSTLINDLLDMDKLLAGKMQFDLQSHNINELVRQAVSMNQAYAQQHKVSFVYQEPTEIYSAQVDASRFQQVLANLLSNSAKFSPVQSQVQIKLYQHASAVRVEIIDVGMGISAKQQANLFTKFYQVDGSSSRQKGGTGLGLAISKELILGMNGEIGVISEEGKGSCFYIELPLLVV